MPLPNGVVEDRAAQSATPEEGALAATSGGKEPSSTGEEADASNPPEAGASSIIPGTAFARSSDLLALAAPEPSAEEDDKEKDSLCMCDVCREEETPPNAEEVSCTDNPCLHWRGNRQEEGGGDGATSICAEEGGEDGATSICAEDGGEDSATSICAIEDGEDGATSTCVEENGVTGLCSEEGGVTSQMVEPELSHAGGGFMHRRNLACVGGCDRHTSVGGVG